MVELQRTACYAHVIGHSWQTSKGVWFCEAKLTTGAGFYTENGSVISQGGKKIVQRGCLYSGKVGMVEQPVYIKGNTCSFVYPRT